MEGQREERKGGGRGGGGRERDLEGGSRLLVLELDEGCDDPLDFALVELAVGRRVANLKGLMCVCACVACN